jgi:hypothetical protein
MESKNHENNRQVEKPKSIQTIIAPIDDDFIIKAKSGFVFADSQLLESIEPLMEEAKKNLRNFLILANQVEGLVVSGQAHPEIISFVSNLTIFLTELREFEIRVADEINSIQQEDLG